MGRAKNRKPTTDAVDILHRRYFEGKPEMLTLLEQERVNAEVAQKVYDLRATAGLTQQELATRVGTKASVICRLEDADYTGHSLTMLQRIAAALGQKVQVNFVPAASSCPPVAEEAGTSPAVQRRPAKRPRTGGTQGVKTPKRGKRDPDEHPAKAGT
jgi:transcriptional regulator with XRE-family HTH domain